MYDKIHEGRFRMHESKLLGELFRSTRFPY